MKVRVKAKFYPEAEDLSLYTFDCFAHGRRKHNNFTWRKSYVLKLCDTELFSNFLKFFFLPEEHVDRYPFSPHNFKTFYIRAPCFDINCAVVLDKKSFPSSLRVKKSNNCPSARFILFTSSSVSLA